MIIPPIVIRDFEIAEGISGFITMVMLFYTKQIPYVNIYGKIAITFILAWIIRKFFSNGYTYIRNKLKCKPVGLYLYYPGKPYPHIDYINNKLYDN